jgi:2,3,4,5-tetrahydropyridine-2-carboxylate N-succinyltransferase
VTQSALETTIERLTALGTDAARDEARSAFVQLRSALTTGSVRAAEPDPSAPAGWRVNAWVKRGILLGFRFGETVDMSADDGRWPFFDKDTLPLKTLDTASAVRIVPGGSTVRDGAWLGRGVICMPPMYVNIGAYVGDETLIDSHALVGSCAQIGARVHLSAAAQIGGVLEPVGALPVIVEDDVLIGGNCGVYEGTIVKRRAVLAAGTVLTASTPLYDLANDRIIERTPGLPLVVPEGAVVVPGTRPVTSGRGREWGLAVATPIIVKYRDERTSARTALETWIR